jgi:hypothetical protein
MSAIAPPNLDCEGRPLALIDAPGVYYAGAYSSVEAVVKWELCRQRLATYLGGGGSGKRADDGEGNA